MNSKITRNLSLKQFRAFVSVAQKGSFSEAAKELAISQPALSLSIQQFEEIVGVPLLIRTTRFVDLTPEGRAFLPKAEKILQDIETAIIAVRTNAEETKNRLDISALTSVTIRVLPSIIRSFSAQNPSVNVHMLDDNGRGVENQVLNGSSAIGISNNWSNHPDLEYTPFLKDQVGLICHNGHSLARRSESINWALLGKSPFVWMAEDTGISRLIDGVEGLPPSVKNPANTVLTMAALVGLIKDGDAVSALPALAAPDYLNPSLVYRKLSDPIVYRELQIITKKNHQLSPIAEAFKNFLRDTASEIAALFPNQTVQPISGKF